MNLLEYDLADVGLEHQITLSMDESVTAFCLMDCSPGRFARFKVESCIKMRLI